MFQNRILQNSLWIIGIKLIQSIITLIIGMLTARYLGPSNYGLISYAASVVAFAAPVMQLGITNIVVRYLVLHKDKEGEIIGSSIVMCLLSSLMCIIGITAFSAIANAGERETIIVCFLYSLSLAFQSIEIIQYWFQAKLISKYISIATLCAYIVVALYKLYLLITQKSIYWFSVSYAIDYALISVILFTLYKKLGGKALHFSKHIAHEMLSSGKYYIVSSMMVVIFAQTDRIMLKLMIDNASVGYYSAAVSAAGMTSFVFSAIIDSFRPVIIEKKSQCKEEYEKCLSLMFGAVIFLALSQSAVMAVFAKIIVSLLYGGEYQSSVSALRIVVWYTTFSYLGSARNVWILAEEKQKYLWILNLSGALGNVVLNTVLIPVWGINGAAVASLITQIFTNIVMNQLIKPIRGVNRLMLRGVTSFTSLKILNLFKAKG